MKRTCLLATAALAAFVVGVPVAVVGRLLGGVLPVRSLDVLLAVFVIGWVQICIAVIKRNDSLDSLTQPRFSLRWQADNLVAQGLLGAGLPSRQPVRANDLRRVSAPLEMVDALLPATAIPATGITETQADRFHDVAVEGTRGVVPSLAVEPASSGPEIVATEEYVVARGDTFWSIAEYAFGDGRHWNTVQELNLGREVAPGIVLNESHEPRIGWSILVPMVASSAATDAPGVDISG